MHPSIIAQQHLIMNFYARSIERERERPTPTPYSHIFKEERKFVAVTVTKTAGATVAQYRVGDVRN